VTPYRTVRQRSAHYPVYIGPSLLDAVGSISAGLSSGPRRTFLLTSEALRLRFGQRVSASFEPPARFCTFEEGEFNKTLTTAGRIVDALLEGGAQRDALAVIVGGGMIGDTAGFAASIFLRGIDIVHVPTTLLAQVDSSIGGKVGVNHPAGKNLIGSFHPPRAVVSDTAVLESLPDRELLSGLFEGLKAGVIADPKLFELLESQRGLVVARKPETIGEIVRRSVDVKADIVSADERESDQRRLLNYGHTIAHGIEASMRYEGITHGEAVAWGMIAANAVAVRRGLLPDSERRRIDHVIRLYGPPPLSALDASEILRAIAHDKKFTGARRVMVLPRAIGACEIVEDIETAELEYAIDAVMG
jgi:3-dehydroquinate synthase